MNHYPPQTRITGRISSVCLCVALLLLQMAGSDRSQAQSAQITPSQRALGERLFRDARFSTTKGDLPASCSSCHLLNEDPQGLRPFADFFNRSWISWRDRDPQRFELRNSPGLFDTAQAARLHYDGEFASLEALVIGTFAGRPMGWLPDERSQALAHLRDVVLNDRGDESGRGAYRELFRAAYQIELEKLGRDELAEAVARAVADFMRTLSSPMKSPYDQFMRVNGLAVTPAQGESSRVYADRLLKAVAELERNRSLKLSPDFNAEALQGLKIFLRAEGKTSVGNCVTCHAPPLFTDNSFHNLGISQVEYDQMHGAGKFATLNIPNAAEAVRPAMQFRSIPARTQPGAVDLGYWNFIELKTSPLRRAGESDDQLLARMIGAMKTPGLRHLAYSYPYFHNGAYSTLEDVLKEKLRLSEMAREGLIRAAADELKNIRLSETDFPALAAFLNSLNEDLKRRD